MQLLVQKDESTFLYQSDFHFTDTAGVEYQ